MSQVRECLVPNGRVRAYLPIFWQHLVQDTTTSGKVGVAAVALVWEAIVGSITVPAIVAVCFFVLDFVSGVVRAARDPHTRFSWQRAGDGFLKLGLYFVMWMTGVLMDLLALESPIGLDTGDTVATVALAIIVWMEIQSIGDNLTSAFPKAGGFFRRLLRMLPAPVDEETSP